MAEDRVEPGRRPEGGFTLIEVLVAVLLTAIAVIGIIALYRTETRASANSRHTTEAAVLANDKLESLRTEALVDGTNVESSLNAQGVSETGGLYTRTSVITDTTNAALTYATIVVTVSWSEDGVAKNVVVNGKRNK